MKLHIALPTWSKSRVNEVLMVGRSSGFEANLVDDGWKAEPHSILITDASTAIKLVGSSIAPGLEIILLIDRHIAQLDKQLRYHLPVRSYIATPDSYPWLPELASSLIKTKSRQYFGIQSHLRNSTNILRMHVSNPDEKELALRSLSRQVASFGSGLAERKFHEYASRVQVAADELLLNALVHGKSDLVSFDLESDYQLGPDQQATLSWGYDGNYFAISVSDPFGSLTRQHVLSHIDRTALSQPREERTSAGAGLIYVFERSEHLVVNVCPGRRTELIALMRFEKRLADAQRKISSLHFFSTEENVG